MIELSLTYSDHGFSELKSKYQGMDVGNTFSF